MMDLKTITGVGKNIAEHFRDIGINFVEDLKDKNPEILYQQACTHAGVKLDRCLLYVFREAVYFAKGGRDPEKLKWWNWKD
ncbi:MAG TPA: helix-hairpin-helix domain-containing protein [bacterium]|nr:helix-hairpin-helix domain-containing protein [bacterium]